MKAQSYKNRIHCAVVFSAAFLLAGCNWLNKSKKESNASISGDALLTVNGKLALTVQEYEAKLKAAIESNPQIQQLLAMMPNAEKDLIFRGFVLEQLMKEWAIQQGLDARAEFQEMRKRVHDSVDAQLYLQEFDKAHPIVVADDEVKKFYNENKDKIPGLVATPAVPGQSEAKYRDVNDPEIKEGLRRLIAEERKQKQLEELLEKMKNDFNVVENHKYFEEKSGKNSNNETMSFDDESLQNDASAIRKA